MPQAYSDWMEGSVTELIIQSREFQIWEPLPGPLSVAIAFNGKHNRQSDLDNLSGSIFDAMVKAEILPNDNMMIVTQLSASIEWSKNEPTTIIQLESV